MLFSTSFLSKTQATSSYYVLLLFNYHLLRLLRVLICAHKVLNNNKHTTNNKHHDR